MYVSVSARCIAIRTGIYADKYDKRGFASYSGSMRAPWFYDSFLYASYPF